MKVNGIQSVISQIAGSEIPRERPAPMLPMFASCIAEWGNRIAPDEVSVLNELCRRVDSENNCDAAWAIVRDVESAMNAAMPPEFRMLSEAVTRSVHDCTVIYENVAAKEYATGILVAIESRCFLATTAHSLPKTWTNGLSIFGYNSRSASVQGPPRFGCDEANNRDVAFVELDPALPQLLLKKPMPLERIHPCGPGKERHWTFVLGFPTEDVTDRQTTDDMIRVFTAECWGNTLIMPQDWSSLPRSDETDVSRDIFIPRPIDDDSKNLRSMQSARLSKPYGMSGGGYWQSEQCTHVWSPDGYRLIGIQSGWWSKGRYLRGTQIIHWLRLLWRQDPSLRSTLEVAFGTAAFT